MTIYWLMLLVPILAGLSPWKAKGALPNLQWIFYGAILILIVGLRHQVGGDWGSYINNYKHLEGTRFFDAITIYSVSRDLGYEIIHWFALNYLNGIYSTNLACAAIFTAGLLRLCKNMPFPWLALVVAIPYLVIVVAMGYTRQGAAIGFIMWGLIDLMNGKTSRFYLMLILGTLFHKTTLFLLPIGFLYSNSISNFRDLLLFGLFFVITFIAFMADYFQAMVNNYITDTQGMESSGAFIRVAMNVFSGTLFLFFRKRWAKKFNDASLWFMCSIISVIMLPLTLVMSTTIDRMALYFIPMQLIVLSRLPILIINTYNRTLFIFIVLALYIGSMYVFLNFATAVPFWVPYHNILFY